ncbi:dimethyl sulfoxide reductase anchor subunit [Paralimibaculum aggregatum]|uniref:Dimethyl sulfoxide reductase anchor subunit n=1 Tax=Paralimibaculum aggregatum TaxID=3036245 RepID=A0ABQ6LCT3_9RHOB|nr:DmsC/YnfH family molybdoenzyme membrane anchor subunit [Limibaculum sp. NKW23]GMG81183.1 dimethyl sulfoxide reductase anchor subunit [Limibaculum sp. NKW23]
MNPAPSLILFTVLSGLGLGMIAWIGLGAGSDAPGFALAGPLVALLLAGIGGVCSAGHLARPDRAWRAFSQWRSSWLSREACLMVLALGAFALFAGLWVLSGIRLRPLGWLAAALALATIHCTAMIYAQLRTVPRWSVTPTPMLFLALGLAGGWLGVQAVVALAGGAAEVGLSLLAVLLGAGVAVHWQTAAAGARRLAAGSSLATATGLGGMGRLRLFEPPHRGQNYLLEEMAFRVGRRRAWQIRLIGAVLGFLLPAALVLLAWLVGDWALLPAFLAHVAGAMALRWLFFAEAEHVQALYYGAPER